MKPETTRRFVLLLIAFAVGSAGLLTPAPASAEKRLFRIHRSFYGAPFPPARVHTHTAMSMWNAVQSMGMTIPLYGGAGRVENQLEPFRTTTPMRATRTMTPLGSTGNWIALPSTAIVDSMNPVGGMITLPRSFIDYQTSLMYYSSTGFTGYTSFSYVTYVNGRARFRKNNPYGATMTARVVFPTTAGNPVPNQGDGSPVTPTTTFGGDFSFSRAGSINITPGPRRFGGTMRILYDVKNSTFSQYIGYYAPTSFFRAYGTFNCLYKGVTCTEDLETRINKIMTLPTMATANLRAGQITSTGMVSRFLLDPMTFPLTKKTHFGMSPGKTPGGVYRKIGSVPAVSKAYYMHLLAPWTTGKVRNYNVDGTSTPAGAKKIAPQLTGYDKVFATPGGMDTSITVTRTKNVYQGQMVNYYYYTSKEPVKGVTRAVSLVRPRIIHTFKRPRIPTDPPVVVHSASRLWSMKVYFVPEPGALLMLGSGVAGLAGLYLLRRNR